MLRQAYAVTLGDNYTPFRFFLVAPLLFTSAGMGIGPTSSSSSSSSSLPGTGEGSVSSAFGSSWPLRDRFPSTVPSFSSSDILGATDRLAGAHRTLRRQNEW